MDNSLTPTRLRTMPTWLIGQAATAAQQAVAARFAKTGSRRFHYTMLAALDESGPMSQVELGRRCGMDRSDVTGAVNELADRGLVVRDSDPEDRRRNVVKLSRSGRSHVKTLDRLMASAQDDVLAPLSANERKQLVKLLAKIADADE